MGIPQTRASVVVNCQSMVARAALRAASTAASARWSVAAQCGGRGRCERAAQHSARRDGISGASAAATPRHAVAVGQYLSPRLAPNPGGAAQAASLADRPLRARAVAQRCRGRNKTQGDTRGTSCRLKPTPESSPHPPLTCDQGSRGVILHTAFHLSTIQLHHASLCSVLLIRPIFDLLACTFVLLTLRPCQSSPSLSNIRRHGPPRERGHSVSAESQPSGGPVHGVDTHPGLLRREVRRYGGGTLKFTPQGGDLDELLYAAA